MKQYILLLLSIYVYSSSATIEYKRRNRSRQRIDYDRSSFLGPFILHLHDTHTHEEVENHIRNLQESQKPFAASSVDAFVSHKYHHVLHGMVVEGMTKADLESLPGVDYVVPDTMRHIMTTIPTTAATMPWGLDRLDEPNLPLDSEYTHYYDGTGVDVYVVDTGIDTNHVEFASVSGSSRVVKNIYDAYGGAHKNNPGADIDGEGHGTHVAGTVGGINVGVSPGANIYGLKVLSDAGEGSVADIIGALDVVKKRASSSGHRSIVTMSLGGPCETTDCSKDSLVKAVESLSSSNIVVSVAAGNEGCNACSGSPNAAPSAINVGAIDQFDRVTYFSNFGQCVDVFAPGWSILSACAHVVCKTENMYWELSGTSMACPHTTGVIAQLLQKSSTASPSQVAKAMACDAARNKLDTDPKDTISRNMVLQVPKNDGAFATCDLGEGCPSDCSGYGVCLPAHANSSTTTTDFCHCDTGRYGRECSANSDTACGSGHQNLKMTLYDSYGDGWTFTNFAILDSSGLVVDNAFDSLCTGKEETRAYCVSPGCYTLEVSRGYFPQEVGWLLCDTKGGAPFTGQFCVTSSGACTQSCDSGTTKVALNLHDAYGDGWDSAYYNVYTPDGTQKYGGNLPTGSGGVNYLCLPQGCSVVMLESGGAHPEEISYDVCGFVAGPQDVVNVCIDVTGNCNAYTLPIDPTCANNYVAFYMFDRGNNGWQGSSYGLYNTAGSMVAGGTLSTGFSEVDNLCLADGCYDLKVTATDKINAMESFWYACGYRGLVPWHSQICVEKAYGLCYGLSGCPWIKSYAHTSDQIHSFISHYDEEYQLEVIDVYDNIHGVQDLCQLADGCYNIAVGAAKYIGDDGRGEYELCGTTMSVPSYGTLCIAGNTTSCTLNNMHASTCDSARSSSHYLAKIDTYGDGWGSGVKYVIRQADNTAIVATGTLADGMYEMDSLCLHKNTCYTFSINNSPYASEVIWVMCGYMGGAPATSMSFCVTDNGCEFEDITDDVYDKVTDDDFPSSQTTPTMSPTLVASPTAAPTTSSSSVTNAPSSTHAPTNSPSRAPTRRPTAQPSTSSLPTVQPTGGEAPSSTPSSGPTPKTPLYFPTFRPSKEPTARPSCRPSPHPSYRPSYLPSSSPSLLPTSQPTAHPTSYPTSHPTLHPISYPTAYPTSHPTTSFPTSFPTALPTTAPTTLAPTASPTTAVTVLFVSMNVTVKATVASSSSSASSASSSASSIEGAVADSIDRMVLGQALWGQGEDFDRVARDGEDVRIDSSSSSSSSFKPLLFSTSLALTEDDVAFVKYAVHKALDVAELDVWTVTATPVLVQPASVSSVAVRRAAAAKLLQSKKNRKIAASNEESKSWTASMDSMLRGIVNIFDGDKISRSTLRATDDKSNNKKKNQVRQAVPLVENIIHKQVEFSESHSSGGGRIKPPRINGNIRNEQLRRAADIMSRMQGLKRSGARAVTSLEDILEASDRVLLSSTEDRPLTMTGSATGTTTVLITCTVQAGVVLDTSNENSAKESVDIAIAVAQTDGSLDSYMDTVLTSSSVSSNSVVYRASVNDVTFSDSASLANVPVNQTDARPVDAAYINIFPKGFTPPKRSKPTDTLPNSLVAVVASVSTLLAVCIIFATYFACRRSGRLSGRSSKSKKSGGGGGERYSPLDISVSGAELTSRRLGGLEMARMGRGKSSSSAATAGNHAASASRDANTDADAAGDLAVVGEEDVYETEAAASTQKSRLARLRGMIVGAAKGLTLTGGQTKNNGHGEVAEGADETVTLSFNEMYPGSPGSPPGSVIQDTMSPLPLQARQKALLAAAPRGILRSTVHRHPDGEGRKGDWWIRNPINSNSNNGNVSDGSGAGADGVSGSAGGQYEGVSTAGDAGDGDDDGHTQETNGAVSGRASSGAAIGGGSAAVGARGGGENQVSIEYIFEGSEEGGAGTKVEEQKSESRTL